MAKRSLLEQAKELAGANPYSSQYVRESPVMLRALIAEVERLQAALERAQEEAETC